MKEGHSSPEHICWIGEQLVFKGCKTQKNEKSFQTLVVTQVPPGKEAGSIVTHVRRKGQCTISSQTPNPDGGLRGEQHNGPGKEI